MNRKELKTFLIERMKEAVDKRDYFSKRAANTKRKRSDRRIDTIVEHIAVGELGALDDIYAKLFPNEDVDYNHNFEITKVNNPRH